MDARRSRVLSPMGIGADQVDRRTLVMSEILGAVAVEIATELDQTVTDEEALAVLRETAGESPALNDPECARIAAAGSKLQILVTKLGDDADIAMLQEMFEAADIEHQPALRPLGPDRRGPSPAPARSRSSRCGAPPRPEVTSELERLRGVMDRLRARCPWDAEQTHRSLLNHLVEETAEVVDAVETGDRRRPARGTRRPAAPGLLPRPDRRAGGSLRSRRRGPRRLRQAGAPPSPRVRRRGRARGHVADVGAAQAGREGPHLRPGGHRGVAQRRRPRSRR